MKKANKKEAPAPTAAPVNLGTKRHCPKCSTRFYDFAKAEVICPKCETKLDPEALNPLAKLAVSPKKAAPARTEDDDDVVPTAKVVGDSDDVIESVDDLGDDEEEIVEDLVEDDGDDEEY